MNGIAPGLRKGARVRSIFGGLPLMHLQLKPILLHSITSKAACVIVGGFFGHYSFNSFIF